MALKPCRECGTDVSTEAITCPRCGVPDPTGHAQDHASSKRGPTSAPGRTHSKASVLERWRQKIIVLDKQELIVRLLIVAGAGFIIGNPLFAEIWLTTVIWVPLLGPIMFMLLMLAFPAALVVCGWAAYVWYQANVAENTPAKH